MNFSFTAVPFLASKYSTINSLILLYYDIKLPRHIEPFDYACYKFLASSVLLSTKASSVCFFWMSYIIFFMRRSFW